MPFPIKDVPECFLVLLLYSAATESDSLKTAIQVVLAINDHNVTIGAVTEYTDCPKSWQLAQRWLTLCNKAHKQCGEQIMDRRLPTRLIDVRMEHAQARLCLARDLPANTRYLTLSHCWGRAKFTTLTQESLETFFSEIPGVALSKTFRDAIKATPELGFRYLWINSLCIIQNDREDCEKEAPSMGYVYANSSLNIEAIDAPDGDSGCFFWREYQPVSCWKLSVYADKDSPDPKVWNCLPRKFNSDNSVLGTRAWAFQERCLALRTLSLGKNELEWECRELKASETLPNGADIEILTVPGILTFEQLEPRGEHIVELWFGVVISYSRGELTFELDKLVAVSGIAQQFAKSKTEYLAGLWREQLVRQLTWYAYEKVGPRTQKYRAPSWSWTSTNSKVYLSPKFGSGTTIELVAVEKVHVTSPGDPFVEVSGGELTLRCRDFGRGRVLPRRDGGFIVMCRKNDRIWAKLTPIITLTIFLETSFIFPSSYQMS